VTAPALTSGITSLTLTFKESILNSSPPPHSFKIVSAVLPSFYLNTFSKDSDKFLLTVSASSSKV